MKKSVRRLASTAVLAALAVPATSFATNGYFSHAYSTKSSGLAGAGVALPEDAMASATNPAGMVWVGQAMDAGAAIFSPHRQYTASSLNGGPYTFPLTPGTVESDSNYFLIPHFGVNWMLDANSSAGVAIYGNGGMNTDYPAFDSSSTCGGPATGTFCAGATGVNLMQLFVNASYSRKINASSSWGISLIAAYQQFEAKGLLSFNSLNFSASPSNLSDNGTDSSTGFGVKIGWQGEVSPGLTLGASYQSKTSMGKFDKYKGLFAEQGSFDIPATATIGLAYKTTPSSTLAFDVQQIYYSDVASIANPIASPGQLGDSNGPGFGWEDMTVYKIGYEWSTSSNWTWRVGYSHGSQPIPNSEVLFNILAPGVIEDHITFGFTQKLSPTSEWNFAAAYMPSKSVSGTNPLWPSQTIELKMYEYQLEASYSWKF